MALPPLGMLNRAAGPGEDCFTFAFPVCAAGSRVPRGGHWIPALTRPSGSVCLSFGSFAFQGREQKAWRGRGFRSRSPSQPGAEPELGQDVRIPAPNSLFSPPTPGLTLSPPRPLAGGTCPCCISPPPQPPPPADVSWLRLQKLWSCLGGAQDTLATCQAQALPWVTQGPQGRL